MVAHIQIQSKVGAGPTKEGDTHTIYFDTTNNVSSYDTKINIPMSPSLNSDNLI